MNKIDTRIALPTLYESNIYVQRSEWGNNSNPHWHRLLFSESLSKYFNDLREKFSNDVADRIATYQECSEENKSKFEEEILSLFEEYRGFYVNRMKHFYTNWNAGLTKNGEERTFSFTFDRKSTVARANMEK